MLASNPPLLLRRVSVLERESERCAVCACSSIFFHSPCFSQLLDNFVYPPPWFEFSAIFAFSLPCESRNRKEYFAENRVKKFKGKVDQNGRRTSALVYKPHCAGKLKRAFLGFLFCSFLAHSIPFKSGTTNLTVTKFGTQLHHVHGNKSLLQIFEFRPQHLVIAVQIWSIFWPRFSALKRSYLRPQIEIQKSVVNFCSHEHDEAVCQVSRPSDLSFLT